MISYSEIPSNLRTPLMFTEFDNSGAVTGAGQQPFKALMIGQKSSAGTHPALDPVLVTSEKDASDYFGAGSMLHEMFQSFHANNESTELICIALDDNSAGVVAKASVKVINSPTVSGTASLRVCEKLVSVGVTASETPVSIATKFKDAINLSVKSVLAKIDSEDTAKVVIEYIHKGVVGNFLDIRQGFYSDEKILPTGMALAIVGFAGGAGNPDILTALAVTPDQQYNTFAIPYTDSANLMALNAFLDTRWGAMKAIEGLSFLAFKGTVGELSTFGDGFNTKFLSTMDAHKSMSGVHRWCAGLAGLACFNMANDPARPMQSLVLKGIYPEEKKDAFTLAERNLLLHDGISTHLVSDNNEVVIERLITMYRKNNLGADDISYLNVETIYTLSYLRWDWNNFFARKYPRHKLAGDNVRVAQGQPVMTPKVAKSEAVARFIVWESLGLVEDVEAFKKGLVVERNSANPDRLDFIITPDLMNQFRVGATQIKFIL